MTIWGVPGRYGARTDLAGYLLCPHNGTVARIMSARGVRTLSRGHNIFPKPKLPQITFLGLRAPLPYATLRDSSAKSWPSRYYILCPSDQNNQARYPLGCKDHKILACAFNLLFS